MKQQIKELIDGLADKSLTFGCRVNYHDAEDSPLLVITGQRKGVYYCTTPWNEWKTYDYSCTEEDLEILGHPILKCHVEAKIPLKQLCFYQKGEVLTQLWHAVDPTLSKSLQEIFGPNCEWETGYDLIQSSSMPIVTSQEMIDRSKEACWPKDDNIRALGELLISLNLLK